MLAELTKKDVLQTSLYPYNVLQMGGNPLKMDEIEKIDSFLSI